MGLQTVAFYFILFFCCRKALSGSACFGFNRRCWPLKWLYKKYPRREETRRVESEGIPSRVAVKVVGRLLADFCFNPRNAFQTLFLRYRACCMGRSWPWWKAGQSGTGSASHASVPLEALERSSVTAVAPPLSPALCCLLFEFYMTAKGGLNRFTTDKTWMPLRPSPHNATIAARALAWTVS